MPTITQPERVAAMRQAATISFEKERKPKKPEPPRGSIMLQMPIFLEIKSVAEARSEPITKLIERAWRVFSAFEGELLRVPLNQRAAGPVDAQ